MSSCVTIKDVALRAGVSTASVSRVVNNNQNISESLRKKVMDAVEELGYVPNPAMAAMAARHFYRESNAEGTPIAYVVQPGDLPSDSLLSMHYKAFKARATAMGYRTDLFTVDASVRPEAFTRIIFHRGMAGIVLDRLFGDLSFFNKIDWSQFCAVSMERRLLTPSFDTIRPGIFEGCRKAWLEVTQRGYRKVGFVLFHHVYSDEQRHLDDEVRDAFCAYAMQQDPPALPPFVFKGSKMPYKAPEGFAKWYESHRPDVLIGFNSTVYHWLKELGLTVPKEIGFVSLSIRQPEEMALTGNMENLDSVAFAAAERIDYLFRRGYQGVPKIAQQIIVANSWNEGKTLQATRR